jgi:acyl carrier protein
MSLTRSEIVRDAVAESIPAPIEEVQLESNLMSELGADSLTFLDIVFRLEEAFDIEITRGEIEVAARGGMSQEEFAPDNVISEAGLARLSELMPEAGDRIQPGLKVAEIYTLFTVRTFLNIVDAKLNGQSL